MVHSSRRETWQHRARAIPPLLSFSLSRVLINANARGQGIVKLPIGFEVVGERNRSPSRVGFFPPLPFADLLELFVEGPLRGLLRRFNRGSRERDNFSARASTKREALPIDYSVFEAFYGVFHSRMRNRDRASRKSTGDIHPGRFSPSSGETVDPARVTVIVIANRRGRRFAGLC